MYYVGVDVGSVSTDIVVMDEEMKVCEAMYLKTKGKPLEVIREGFKKLDDRYSDEEIKAIGATGSGREIAAFLIGADIIKNEITAHAVAALNLDKEVKTILEIGGQDSKIIIIKNGVVTDFAMNTVCAAGTGSFLDRQAERLGIKIEQFGGIALESKKPVRIAGRCAVFAESDMIHKQQVGYREEDIINGLCQALVRNYLNNVGKGKDIKSKIFFQGGVAANEGMKRAFEMELGEELYVPKHYNVMGAIGAGIIARDFIEKNNVKTKFKGFKVISDNVITKSFECNGCSNKCEVVKIVSNENSSSCFGDRCGKWSNCS